MQIFCENPTIIVNPHINQYIYKYGNYVLDGEVHIVRDVRTFSQGYTCKYFSAHRNGVTMDNIENYGVLTDSGLQPMFFAVPCGRCVLCREKKASEWSFRALCENQSSSSEPLFVTLTYNEKHKPKRGVEKRAVQAFIKRLRRNLDKLNIVHQLRYFACGEYGTKSKRPHYHLILWNFPRTSFGTLHECLTFIEKAWRVFVVDRLKRPIYLKNGAPKTESQGFAYCVPCQKGAISYVMKYMRKDCIPPEGCNDVFFLSSRRNGGIGAPHFKQYINFYRRNPDCVEFTVYDRYSGKQQTKLLPSYFRSLVWPSASRIIVKEDRDVYQSFINNLQKRAAYELPFEGVVSEHSTLLFEDEKALIKDWSLLGVTYDPDFVDPHFRFRLSYMNSEQREKTYQRLCETIETQLEYLKNVEIPVSYFVSRETSLEIRRKFLEENLQKKERDLNDVKWNIISRRKLEEYKEKL